MVFQCGSLLLAITEDIRDQAHGVGRWKDIRPTGDVFFQDVILDRSTQGFYFHTLRFGDGDIHGKQDGCRCIDGHAGGNFSQGDLVEQGLHILQGGDRYPHFTHFTLRHGVIGIVTDLRGQVECHRETGLPLFEQVAVAAVGFFCGWHNRHTGAWSRSARGTWWVGRRG